MGALGVIIIAIICCVIGFLAGQWFGQSKGTEQLTQSLEEKEQELNELKAGVDEHFSETARLFGNLTDEYKNLYQHLAQGAGELSTTTFTALPSVDNSSEQNDLASNTVLDGEYSNTAEQNSASEARSETLSKATTENSNTNDSDVQQPLDYVEESELSVESTEQSFSMGGSFEELANSKTHSKTSSTAKSAANVSTNEPANDPIKSELNEANNNK